MANSIKIVDELKARAQNLESLVQKALASWAAHQETGQHLTGKEVRTWLDAWGTEAETELPQCHE